MARFITQGHGRNIPILRGRFRSLTARVLRFPKRLYATCRVYIRDKPPDIIQFVPAKEIRAGTYPRKEETETRDIESSGGRGKRGVEKEQPSSVRYAPTSARCIFSARTLFARFISHLRGTVFLFVLRASLPVVVVVVQRKNLILPPGHRATSPRAIVVGESET